MKSSSKTSLRVFFLLTYLLAVFPAAWAKAEQNLGQLTVKTDQPGTVISPMFYGLMTEEINHAYDGGLYAELIRNRVFQDAPTPEHWSLVAGDGAATMRVDTTQPVPNTRLTHSLRIEITRPGSRGGGAVTVANDGYWGIPVMPRTKYRVSFWAKADAKFHGPITASLKSSDGNTVFAEKRVPKITTGWKKYTLTLQTGNVASSKNNRFVLTLGGVGTVWLTQISLFPPTYKNRPNGLRPDLMRLMQKLNPAYLRFPGGNYLEGNTVAERFDWKQTIGPIEQRPGHSCPWGYRSTDGLGLLEFLEWCEDLNMEPVLGVFAGYALNGEYVAAGPQLEPFVQDALDEIEYLTGPITSKWGARRAQDGHPKPFALTYVEVGNEDWFDRSGSYENRFAQFYDAIKITYPKLQIIATRPVNSRPPDVLDDHYYRSAAQMAADANHYAGYARNGPKIFVGEWASTEGSPTPTLQAALGDAAWLTGLEPQSDLVVMQCYAPLLVNVNPGARQWGTNLIGYDALNSYGSPSYWAQAMFGSNRGDVALPVEIQPAAPAQTITPRGRIGVGTWDTQAEFDDIKVTAPNGDVLYQQNFASGAPDFETNGGGDWNAENGVYAQTGNQMPARALIGDPAWTDYTLTLRARKTGGREGFLILFHARDPDNFLWWNIGGWGNTRTAIERAQNGAKAALGPESPVSVETNRWYDLRVEVSGDKIRGYVDGKLVTETTDAPPPPLYATASRDNTRGEIILKVVNFSPTDQPLQVNLPGAANVAATASGQVLVGPPDAVNSIENPTNVAPKALTLTGIKNGFTHSFPAHSVTVLKIKAGQEKIMTTENTSNSPLAPSATLEKLAGDFAFTEGPAADKDGNVYFTDQPNDRILKWSVDGKLTTFLQPAGRSNGMVFDRDGLLWSCADGQNELWTIDTATKKITVLVKDYTGKLLNGPNDVWVRPDGGGAYFTDPFYKRDYWQRGPMEQEVQGVYYLAPDHKTLTRVVSDMTQPNGIIGTPDGKTLYVADIGAGETFAFDVQPDGTLANKRLFCKLGSDGMTIDDAGNVYLTGKGVTVFDKTGQQIAHIPVPEDWSANVCIGGKNHDTLFITASKGLYAIRLRTHGVR